MFSLIFSCFLLFSHFQFYILYGLRFFAGRISAFGYIRSEKIWANFFGFFRPAYAGTLRTAKFVGIFIENECITHFGRRVCTACEFLQNEHRPYFGAHGLQKTVSLKRKNKCKKRFTESLCKASVFLSIMRAQNEHASITLSRAHAHFPARSKARLQTK